MISPDTSGAMPTSISGCTLPVAVTRCVMVRTTAFSDGHRGRFHRLPAFGHGGRHQAEHHDDAQNDPQPAAGFPAGGNDRRPEGGLRAGRRVGSHGGWSAGREGLAEPAANASRRRPNHGGRANRSGGMRGNSGSPAPGAACLQNTISTAQLQRYWMSGPAGGQMAAPRGPWRAELPGGSAPKAKNLASPPARAIASSLHGHAVLHPRQRQRRAIAPCFRPEARACWSTPGFQRPPPRSTARRPSANRSTASTPSSSRTNTAITRPASAGWRTIRTSRSSPTRPPPTRCRPA